MVLYLISDDVVKLPVTLTADQSCNDKFIELVQPTEVGTSVLYKGVEVWAVSCHKGTGEWVRWHQKGDIYIMDNKPMDKKPEPVTPENVKIVSEDELRKQLIDGSLVDPKLETTLFPNGRPKE